MAFLEFPHIVWEATKPTIVLTDNKSITRFFQTKAIPPALWNACDYVLQFNFKIAHIAGSVKFAADFLPRLKLEVIEKICIKVREDIQKTHIEVTASSSDAADGDHFFFHTSRQQRRVRRTNPWTKKRIQTKCEAMGSEWGTILLEDKCERIYKDRRKHNVVFHKWNQGKCTNT